MAQKIKYVLIFLILWAAGFLAWEWWNSYPKVKLKTLVPEQSLKGKIDSVLHQAIHEYRLPGVSLALVKDGKVIYLNAVGYQNLNTKDSLSTETLIPIASVSKIFTALAIAHSGVFLEKSAEDYIHDSIAFQFPKRSFYQLLEHRSGLSTPNTFLSRLFGPLHRSLEDWAEDYIKNLVVDDSLSYPEVYSDSNYDLLGYWIEKQFSVSFQDQVAEHVLDAAGMKQSFFMDLKSSDTLSISGYQHTFLWKRLDEIELKLQIFPSPSSGLLTNTKDMSLALIHLLRGEMGNFQKELTWLEDRENSKLLGFQKIRILESDWLGHFGGQAGYSSLFFFSKSENIGIFLFFNLKDPADYRLQLSETILTLLLEP